MNVSLRQLRVFETVARLLSYTRAAAELHLTQPAVSMQVRQLEEEEGLPLFEKLGKQISLTEAGRKLFHYSRTIDRSLQEMEEVVESLKGVSCGRLSIAVASTVNYFAPRLLAAFHLDVTNRERLIHQLRENAVDMMLMGQPPQAVEVGSEAFNDQCPTPSRRGVCDARARLRHPPGYGTLLRRARGRDPPRYADDL